MFEKLPITNVNFNNNILAKLKMFHTQTNFSKLNLLKDINLITSPGNREYINIPQRNETIKNIRVNKIKFDNINKYNTIYFQTNRDFYHNRPFNKRNKSTNFMLDNFSTINFINNYNNLNDLLFLYKQKRRKSGFYSLDKNLNDNSYNHSLNINKENQFYKKNMLLNLVTDKKKNIRYSKKIYNFKNMRMFYAHLEILISLYLKRNFNYFIKHLKQYIKTKKIVNLNLYNTFNNQNQPIINLNNAHCSLYCSININKNNNEIFNTNNSTTPLKTNDEYFYQSMKNITKIKNNINNNKNQKCTFKKVKEIKKNSKNNNKAVYVPKNKTKKLKINNSKDLINENKNSSNNVKKSSPIKEMNIDLKKMNLNQNKSKNLRAVNNLKNENNKLKLSNSINNINKRPKDNNNISKNLIKEIKIQNKETFFTPYENKNKIFFETIYSFNQIHNSKEKNNIKNIYINKNNNNAHDFIKANLFRNNSDISKIKNYSNFLNNNSQEILVKNILTSDKRISINIKYVILDSLGNNKSKSNLYILLKAEHVLTLSIIKNSLILQKDVNLNIIFSDIFAFDNDKKSNKQNKNIKGNIKGKKHNKKENKNVSILTLSKIIKDSIIKNIRKYILIEYKRYNHIKKLIINKNKKILKLYFERFLQNDKKIKSGIYHKINYNDDFNLSKKIKSPINNNKNVNIESQFNPFNLDLKNNNILFRNNNRKNKNKILALNNFSYSYKYFNKEINITVHENKDKINNIKKKIDSYNSKK